MAKWSKKTFIEHINQSCENDVAVNCLQLIDFSEKNSDEITWGTGDGCGTMTFRCHSDYGLLPLFRLSSNGKINLQINFLRGKNLHKQILEDMIVKLESNFLSKLSASEFNFFRLSDFTLKLPLICSTTNFESRKISKFK